MNAQAITELDARIEAINAAADAADHAAIYEPTQDMINAVIEAQGPIPVATQWTDAERYFELLG